MTNTVVKINNSDEQNKPFIKKCSKCSVEKLSTEFFKTKKNKSGIKSYCKYCSYEMRKDWIKRNKNKEKEYYSKYRVKTVENYKERQLKKQLVNKCKTCGCSLIGRQLLTKYCKKCKAEIKKAWNRESYKRNIKTYVKYNADNRSYINEKNRFRDLNKRKELADRYITKLLREKNGFTVEQLKNNNEIIEVKRLIIKTKRL